MQPKLGRTEEPLEDGEMTPPSGHSFRNSNSGGLRPRTQPLGHRGTPEYRVLRVDGEETFLFLSNRRDRKRAPKCSVNGSGANHYPIGPPPLT